MGVRYGQEQATQVVTGTFTAPDQVSAVFSPDVLGSTTGHPNGRFNAAAWGTWPPLPVATSLVRLEQSFDDGVHWVYFGDVATGDTTWWGTRARSFSETEPGVQYRFRADTTFAGAVTYRISQ